MLDEQRERRRDAAAGTLLAAACGDALGVPYEFGVRPLRPGEPPRMLGGGLGGYAPGEYSDDTQMTVPIARAAAAGHDLRDDGAQDLIAEAWMSWLASGATDVGTQTRAVLATATHDAVGRPAQRLRRAAQALHARTGRAGGNGSLMRTAPVALAYLEDAQAMSEAARAVGDLTHPDPMAGDACVLWCAAIRAAVVDGELIGPWAGLDLVPSGRRDEWASRLRDAEDHRPETAVPNGYAPVTLQAAWSAISHTRAEPTGQRRLVAALHTAIHVGDDTDTVASVAGALLGAYHGASVVPPDWRETVHGWPGLTGRDLERLAVDIVESRT